MEPQIVASFLDELEKIAVAGQVAAAPKPPKTSAPTPAPAARAAPQHAVKAPQMPTPIPASSGGAAAPAARPQPNPALANLNARFQSSGAINRRSAVGGLVPRARTIVRPQARTRPIKPDIRGVVTRPMGRPSFIPPAPSAAEFGG